MTNNDAEKILMFVLRKHSYVDIMSLRYKDAYFLYVVEDENYYAIKSKISTIRPYATAYSDSTYCILEQITLKSNSYVEMLESILNACKSNDIYIDDSHLTLLLKKGTTLERLLVEMELSEIA